MIPAPRTEYERLSSTEIARVDAACDRFEKAWKAATNNGDRPAIPEFCGDVTEPALTVLIWELIALDRDYRIARGETPRPDDYRGLCTEYDDQLPAETPTQFAGDAGKSPRPINTGPWPDLPGFKIVEVLGTGGMGVVYKAWQAALDRYVAIKMLRNAALAEPGQRERFTREARAVAQLHHHHLVQVYAVGEAPAFEGAAPSPYFVMDYVSGGSLADHLRGTPQRPRAAAQFVLTLARAMSHVHAQGIVHRDLKPGNILLHVASGARTDDKALTPQSGSSTVLHGAFYHPKITDFGLAKLGGGDLTRTGDTLGTPSYMAPEQTEATSDAVGPATDIYGLGAILYEALTGRPPFQAETALATVMQVRTDDPVSVRRLQPTVPRDLETICLKCLRKEPRRRYASADALADDLSRFLDGEPIHARPVSALGRAAKWALRRPMIAALWALVILLTVGGFAGILTQWLRAESLLDVAKKARVDADTARAKETNALDRHRIMRAYDEWLSDNAKAARDLLRDTKDRKDTWEGRYVNRLCNVGRFTFDEHQMGITGLAYSPDGSQLMSCSRDGAIIVRDLVNGKVERVTVNTDRVEDLTGLSVSPADGRYLAAIAVSGNLYIYDLMERKTVANWPAHEPGQIPGVAFSRDGRFLATWSGFSAKIWDVQRRRVLHTLKSPTLLLQMCWSPDGRYVGSCGNGDQYVYIWEAVSGKEFTRLSTVSWFAGSVAFSPDNSRFAWTGMDGVVATYDATKFAPITTLAGPQGYQDCLAFSPDGRLVAAGSFNGPVRIWNVETSQMVLTLHGHSSGVRFLAFSPDGSQLATAGTDKRIHVWDILDQQEVSALRPRLPGRLLSVAFSPNGRYLATAVSEFRLWDLELRKHVFTPIKHVPLCVAFHPNGEQFAGADNTGVVYAYDIHRKELAKRQFNGPPLALQYTADGRNLLVAGPDNAVYAWEPGSKDSPVVVLGPLAKGETGVRLDECHIAFSPDRRWLAVSEWNQPVTIWDLQLRAKFRTLDDVPQYVLELAFDSNGRFLAVGGSKGDIQIRDVQTGDVAKKWTGHPQAITGLNFTPDAARLASVARDGCVKLWDTHTGDEVLSLRGQATFDTILAFSPDGERLVAGGWDGDLRVWSIKDPQEETVEVRTTRRRDWHKSQATASLLREKWYSARHHLGQLVQLEPEQWQHHRSLGRAHAELGEWDKAAAEFDAAVEHPSSSIFAFADRANLYLRAADREGFRNVCRRMTDRFGASEEFADVNTLVWMSVLTPQSSISADQLVQRAERAVAKADNAQRNTMLSTLGAALCRANRYEDAISRLLESVKADKSGGHAEDWLFLALAFQKIGNKAEAAVRLRQVSDELANVQKGARLADGRPLSWWLRIEIDVLFQEAKSTAAEKSP